MVTQRTNTPTPDDPYAVVLHFDADDIEGLLRQLPPYFLDDETPTDECAACALDPDFLPGDSLDLTLSTGS